MNDEDYDVEDLFNDLNKKREKKKKIDSKSKGARGENSVIKILTQRFNQPFSRVIGSGNRWSQANLSEEAKLVLTGDVVTPTNFKFCIESKNGYNDVDLCNALNNGNATLDEFMSQAQKDASRVNRKPLICWKKNRMGCICFLKQDDLPDFKEFKIHLCYNEWVAVSFSELLKKEDSFFFKD